MSILFNILTINDLDESINYAHANPFPGNDYKPDLSELLKIFNNNPNDIFKYNTKDCFSLILNNETEISLHEYIQYQIEYADILFLHISDKILKENDADILISLKNVNFPVTSWQYGIHYTIEELVGNPYWYLPETKKSKIDSVCHDVNGFDICMNLIKNTDESGKLYAICHCIDKCIKTDLNQYKGYLPSVYQMKVITECIKIYNYCFYKICDLFEDTFPEISHAWHWTCNEFDEHHAWYVYVALNGDIAIEPDIKVAAGCILPLFKKI